jgi:nicotinamide mononucleotide transporter
MSLLEFTAALFGVVNIILIIRRSVWNYPFALVMVALYFLIFWDLKLKSDAGLQIFFFAVNLYGWWSWKLNKADVGTIRVLRLTRVHHALWVAGTVSATLIWGSLMAQLTDASYPYWDAAVAMLSVVGQILMTRRYIENWHWWIVVNIISMPLYYIKGIYYTVGLYGLFLILAIVGLSEWRKAERI